MQARIAAIWDKLNTPAEVKFRGHIRELDGLRAIGICLVVINHVWTKSLSNVIYQLGNFGWIAMDSFFVMSGFLITGILLDSRDSPGYYRTYYTRRALRILPLYYLVLVLWWWIARHTNWGRDSSAMLQHWGSPIWFAFYMGNIKSAVVGAWPDVRGYIPLWSLQVEEQYYLLFPLAVAWLRRDHLRRLLIAAVILSPVLRVLTYLWQPANPYIQYVLLPCHSEGLALGGLIAIRSRGGSWKIPKMSLTLCMVVLLGAACIGSIMSTYGTQNWPWTSQWDRLVGYSVSSAGCGCLVLWLISFRGSRWTGWMRWAPVQYLGRISYGIYLLHQLAMWVIAELAKKGVVHFHKNDPSYFFEVVALSLILAAISWHLIEGPFLRLKDRIPYYRDKLRPIEIQQSGTTA